MILFCSCSSRFRNCIRFSGSESGTLAFKYFHRSIFSLEYYSVMYLRNVMRSCVYEKMAGIRFLRRGSDGKPAAGRLVTGHATLDRAIFGSLKQAGTSIDRKPSCLPPGASIASDWIKEASLRVGMFTYIRSCIYLLPVYSSKRIHIDIRRCLRGLNAIGTRDLSLSLSFCLVYSYIFSPFLFLYSPYAG